MPEAKDHIYYLLFSSIHGMLKAEKKLKERGLRFELMPIPRNLSSDCGSCIRLHDDIAEAMLCIGDDATDRRFLYDGKDYIPL